MKHSRQPKEEETQSPGSEFLEQPNCREGWHKDHSEIDMALGTGVNLLGNRHRANQPHQDSPMRCIKRPQSCENNCGTQKEPGIGVSASQRTPPDHRKNYYGFEQDGMISLVQPILSSYLFWEPGSHGSKIPCALGPFSLMLSRIARARFIHAQSFARSAFPRELRGAP